MSNTTDPENQSPRLVWSHDLVTSVEIAKVAGVKPHTIDKWTRRYRDTPIPVKITGVGNLYMMSDWLEWLKATGRDQGRLPSFAEKKAIRERQV